MQKCELCETPTEQTILTDDGEMVVCEDCDHDFKYCQVCECRYFIGNSTGDTCRHLHWHDDLGWCGCGSAECSPEQHKPSFFRLLDRIGATAAQALKHSLRSHKYHNQFTMYGVDAWWINPKGITGNYNDVICHEISCNERDAIEIGVKWLVSLWSDDDKELKRTPEFDLMTANWVEEWEQNYSRTASKKYPNTDRDKIRRMSSGILIAISYFGASRYVNLDKFLDLFITDHIGKTSKNFQIIMSDKSSDIRQQLMLLPYSRHIKAWHDGKELSPDDCRKILFNI